MGAETKIAWCDHTFNPWWGCTEVSPECNHCYARTWAKRTGFEIWGKDAPRRFFGDKHWAEPLKWNQDADKAGVRRRVFCGSMCDVMEDGPHPRVFDPVREQLYALIERTPSLDWLLLTKRPQNFRRFLPEAWLNQPRPNVWGMTTVGSDEQHWRAWELLKTPFAVRGISAEPLLGPLDLDKWELVCKTWRRGATIGVYLDWVIVGAESGYGARPMDHDWVRLLRDQCQSAGVAFFYKQDADSRGRAIETPELDGRRWMEFPEVRNAR